MRKLTKSEYTPAEVRQELANLLQEKIDTYGSELRKLREREVGRTALAKGDLCLLCAQLPAKCVCMSTLRKASVSEVNGEMKGYKSIATNPTFGGGKITNAPKTAPRAGNGNRAASGVIPNAKAEPKAGKKFKIPRSGKLKKHTAAMPSADPRPAPSGIPGKQPVGQGGGDAFKVPHPATTASLNDVRQMAPSAANATKDKAALPKAPAPAAPKPAAAAMPKAGMHPETKASLGAVQAQAPKAAWAGSGLPNLKAKLQGVQAGHALAPKPAPAAAQPSIGQRLAATPAKPVGNPAALRTAARPANIGGVRANAQLAADKRAGGVGFLNNLLSRFRRPAASPPSAAPAQAAAAPAAAPVQSKRFHGALPLQRSEPDAAKKPKKAFALDKCAMCRKAEHTGMCKQEMDPPTQGLTSANHNRTMLRVGQSEHAGTRKQEMDPPTQGLAAANHNRTMLRVGQSGQRRGKSKR
jgi:hypothetical protein